MRPEDVEWVQGGLEDPGRLPFEPVEPAGIRLGFAPPDRSLARMLADGEINALITAPDTVHVRPCRVQRAPALS